MSEVETSQSAQPAQPEQPAEEKELAIATHARRLYDAMLERSYQEDDVHVFVGKVTELFNQLGISSAYYSRIRRMLIQSGSIQIVKRGARGVGSEVRLYRPPEDFTFEGLTHGANPATLLVELETRVRRLEAWRESQGGINISQALRNHENRLSQLERDSEVTK
jgi:hypothetical protein